MSQVTNLLIIDGSLINELTIMVLSLYLEHRYGGEPLSAVTGCGGTKEIEVDVYLAAYNYLDLGDLIKQLESLVWTDVKAVQVFVMEQSQATIRQVFPRC